MPSDSEAPTRLEAFHAVADPDTEWEIVESGSPATVDGMAPKEPKTMRCRFCGAQTIIDAAGETTTGIDELTHKTECPQKNASTRPAIDPGDAFDSPEPDV